MKKILNFSLKFASARRNLSEAEPQRGGTSAKQGFSLIELIIVIAIIGVLSGVAYVGIQRAKMRTMNDKVLDDLIAISNALEQYKRDHFGSYPVPEPGGTMNVNCYYADASYAHDCSGAAFRQGMIDNHLLSKRYLQQVPTDPRTNSRYVYGVTNDGKYFMVAGVVEESAGNWEARTAENLAKGYHLPSLIRAYDGPNFVINKSANLPYSPDHLIISATLQNVNGAVTVNTAPADPSTVVYKGDTIMTDPGSTVDLYFSDGSITHLEPGTEFQITEESVVSENDKDNIITIIKTKLLSGKIWNKVARLASASQFEVETSTAIAGVRGTEFGLTAVGELIVKAGEIDVLSKEEEKIGSVTAPGDASDPQKTVISEGGVGGTESADPAEIYPDHNKAFLNDNIRPQIVKIEGTTFTIADINRNSPAGREFAVDTLKAYSGNSPAGEWLISSLSRDADNNYQFDWMGISEFSGQPIVFRFEYAEGDVTHYSGFSTPAITVPTDTANWLITQKELNPELPEGPVLVVYAPTLAKPNVPFTVSAHLQNFAPREDLRFKINLTNPATASCTLQTPGTDDEKNGRFNLNADDVTGDQTATCPFTVQAVLQDADGNVAEIISEETKTVTIGEEVAAPALPCNIALTFPRNNATGVNQRPTLQWSVNGQCDETYSIMLDGTSEAIAITDGHYPLTTDLTPGTPHTWSIVSGSQTVAGPYSFTTGTEVVELCDISVTGQPTAPVDPTSSIQLTIGAVSGGSCDEISKFIMTVTYNDTTSGDSKSFIVEQTNTTGTATTMTTTQTLQPDNTSYAWSIIGVSSESEILSDEEVGSFETGAANLCGNDTIDIGETCDGSDIGGAQCPTGSTGTPACNADCTLNTSSPHCTAITLATECSGANTYYDSGSDECWVLGNINGENCESACDTLDNPNKGVDIKCASGDWNDLSGDVCLGLRPDGNVGGWNFNSGYAPYFIETQWFKRCYSRNVNYQFSSTETLCNAATLSGKQRICKCEF